MVCDLTCHDDPSLIYPFGHFMIHISNSATSANDDHNRQKETTREQPAKSHSRDDTLQ